MTRRTISQVLVDALAAQGVEHVFGVVGDALNSVTDAIRTTDGIRWVGVRHEEAGAYAAGAQAQLGAPLGVCAGTVGPGSIHLLNGLYDAAKSHAPVLAIAGQVPLAKLGTDFFQAVDNDLLFRDVAVYRHTITSGEQIPYVIDTAIAAAISQRGVAVLSLPADVGTSEVDASTPRAFAVDSPTTPPRERIDEAIALVERCEQVTLLVGVGASHAREDVLELADRLGAPMVVTLKAKPAFDWDNPFDVGQNGLIGNPAASDAFRDCDLLIMVGTDFPYRDWYPDDTPVIQIDDVAAHIGRRTPVTVGLVGDSATTVSQLLDGIRPRSDRSFLDRVRGHHERWLERQRLLARPEHDETLVGRAQSQLDNRGGDIRPEAVAATVGELAADDAIFTSDTGMSTVWLARFLRLRRGQDLLGSFNLGSMANAMPQAIGAQLRYPDRQVVAFCGDGGFTMLLGDLLTAVSERLPVKLIVFDNRRLGMVKLEQEEAGMPEHGTQLANPDFAEVAVAMGATGIRIEDPDELRSGVARALRTDGPTVVDVVTNPDEIIVPSEPTVGQAWGYATARVKEVLRSRGDD